MSILMKLLKNWSLKGLRLLTGQGGSISLFHFQIAISKIVIENRRDCCQERAAGLMVCIKKNGTIIQDCGALEVSWGS